MQWKKSSSLKYAHPPFILSVPEALDAAIIAACGQHDAQRVSSHSVSAEPDLLTLTERT